MKRQSISAPNVTRISIVLTLWKFTLRRNTMEKVCTSVTNVTTATRASSTMTSIGRETVRQCSAVIVAGDWPTCCNCRSIGGECIKSEIMPSLQSLASITCEALPNQTHRWASVPPCKREKTWDALLCNVCVCVSAICTLREHRWQTVF